MSASRMRYLCALLTLVLGTTLTASADRMPGGQLQILGPEGAVGACPLKHTNVEADIAGFLGRVTVRQIFHNPTDRKIEAIYVFPLPDDAAVDDMVMFVGDRKIVGQIKEREEAQEIYEAARAAGYVASLLDQERPNIFTQSVANIEPGVEVIIELSYVETLRYEDGLFEWVFPMVVGPRYIPGGGSAPAPMTTGQPTPEVPDADRITPPVTPKGTRAGHDIDLTVTIDGGMPVKDVACELHDVDVAKLQRRVDSPVQVTLKNKAEIPNRDFILSYRLEGNGIGDAFLLHEDERGHFFTLILQPPERVVPARLVARELIFVLDTSGSMRGFPIDKSKEVMNQLIGTMRPEDTFNVITFAGNTRVLWNAPRAASNRNIAKAQKFLNSHTGGGGTEMMKAIRAALERQTEGHADAIRVVCFMTDGYVGNDFEIIDAIKKNVGTTRVFAFGAGNSVNRFLLDGMAQAGRGEVEYVTLAGDADAAVERFHERILAPVLTDIAIDWGALPVEEVYPQHIPDLFSTKPIVVHGRLAGPATGTFRLLGNTGSGPYEAEIDVAQPEAQPDHPAIASLWARAKVADLMMQDYFALQRGEFPDELKQQIIELGLDYRLMTQFTSFVAVEEMTVTADGESVTVRVPVEMPEGVSYEGVFGEPVLGARFQVLQGLGYAGGKAGGRGRAAPSRVPRTGRMVAPKPVTADAEEMTDRGFGIKLEPADKLAASLRGLADKVTQAGPDGNFADGRLKVVDHRVDVMIYLSDMSTQTVEQLTKLGFVQTSESKAIALVIGSIDVRKLEELVELEVVLRVRPVVEP